MKKPKNFAKIIKYWMRDKAKKAAAYPPKAGPDRETMMAALGLPAEADIIILAERRREMQKKAA